MAGARDADTDSTLKTIPENLYIYMIYILIIKLIGTITRQRAIGETASGRSFPCDVLESMYVRSIRHTGG